MFIRTVLFLSILQPNSPGVGQLGFPHSGGAVRHQPVRQIAVMVFKHSLIKVSILIMSELLNPV